MSEVPLIGSVICDGYFPPPTPSAPHDKRSLVQVWNPADSGVNLLIDELSFAWTTFAAWAQTLKSQTGGTEYCGLDLDWHDKPIGGTANDAPVRCMMPKAGDMSAGSKIELRAQIFDGDKQPGRIFAEFWLGERGNTCTMKFPDPLVVRPGMGVLVRSALASCYNIVTAQGRTVEIEAPASA